MRRLPFKRRLFVLEYLKDLNATRAAKRAGYKHPHVDGSRLLAFVSVQDAIQVQFDKRAKRLEIESDRVLLEIARLAYSDVRKIVDEQNRLRNLSTLDDDTAAAIAGVEFDELGNIKKIRYWDKTANLTLLAKHLRLIVERQAVEGELKHTIVEHRYGSTQPPASPTEEPG